MEGLFRSRLESTPYSLSWYTEGLTPPSPHLITWSTHTVTTEISELELWDESKWLPLSYFWNCPDFYSTNEMNAASLKALFPSIYPMIATLMQDIKLLVKEKQNYDILDEWFSMLLWSHRTITILMKVFLKLMLHSETLVEFQCFPLRPWWRESSR